MRPRAQPVPGPPLPPGRAEPLRTRRLQPARSGRWSPVEPADGHAARDRVPGAVGATLASPRARQASSLRTSHAETGLRVEQVEPVDVDRDLERLTFPRARLPLEARHEADTGPTRLLGGCA